MRDPFSWAIPLGRLFGITIKVHFLFPVIVIGMVLRAAWQKDAVTNAWIDASIVCGLLFFSVLLHEFGHCFMARNVGGEGTEVLLWPLGGLANVELPQQPRAHFLTAMAGPAVNFVLAGICVLALLTVHDRLPIPSLNPLGYPGRVNVIDENKTTRQQIVMNTWIADPTRDPAKDAPKTETKPDAKEGTKEGAKDQPRQLGPYEMVVDPYSAASFLNWFFWVNWVLFLLNMMLVGYPLDAGRMVQAALWPRMGYRQATLAVVYAGYFVAIFILGVASIALNETLALALGLFVGVACYVQQFQLQSGEESLFGYDFSQGYTSLERDQEGPPPAPKQPRQSWWQRWMQQRAEKKARREAEQREAEERRMDELLEKVQRAGLGSLTEEERRFMKRVSERLRNRKP
jgi:Zn-dependent protease